jgi:hypothetical protein
MRSADKEMKTVITLIVCLFIASQAFSQALQKQESKPYVIFMQPKQTFNLPLAIPYKNEQAIPRNFYTQHLGFFCREEIKMQQVHIPVTFRLGSMDYCNQLEQKPGCR